VHIVVLSTTAVEFDTIVRPTNASLSQNQCLQCVTTPLTHVEITRSREATELNNDGMIKFVDIHYHGIQNRIYQFFRKRFNQRRLQFLFAYSFRN